MNPYREALFRLNRMAARQQITEQEVKLIVRKAEMTPPGTIAAEMINHELDQIEVEHGPDLPL